MPAPPTTRGKLIATHKHEHNTSTLRTKFQRTTRLYPAHHSTHKNLRTPQNKPNTQTIARSLNSPKQKLYLPSCANRVSMFDIIQVFINEFRPIFRPHMLCPINIP